VRGDGGLVGFEVCAQGEGPVGELAASARKGSFDSVTGSLREPVTTLRMTGRD